MNRADMIAHFLEHGTRESYAAEQAKAAAHSPDHEKKGIITPPNWSQFSQSRET